MIDCRANSGEDMGVPVETVTQQAPQATVIPGADSLIGDLLDMDLGPPAFQMQQQQQQQAPPPSGSAGGGLDLLGEGLDSLLGGGGGGIPQQGGDLFGASAGGSTFGGLGEIFGLTPSSSFYVPPQEVGVTSVLIFILSN